MIQGTVLRIEKISPNDGRGLRTVVFLKGCPLRCAWCSTPESQKSAPELYYRQASCLRCGRCIRACPQGALSPSPDGTAVTRDVSKCTGCFRCAGVCPGRALGVYGRTMTVEQVMQEIRKDRMFYFFSDGGVTLSGGDILLQADFASAILEACRADCIHTMAEMDCFGFYGNMQKVISLLDGYYVDIKCMDAQAHKRWTGADNRSILENIRRASAEFPDTPLHARVPLIPGVNDSPENLRATAEFCASLPSCAELELLPYHRLGTATYAYLSRTYALDGLPRLSPDAAAELLARAELPQLPFPVRIAGLGQAG